MNYSNTKRKRLTAIAHSGSVHVIQSLQDEGVADFHGEESTRSFLAVLREASAQASNTSMKLLKASDLQHGRFLASFPFGSVSSSDIVHGFISSHLACSSASDASPSVFTNLDLRSHNCNEKMNLN